MGRGARLLTEFDKLHEPRQALVEDGGLQPVDDRLPDLARGDESGAAQQPQVVGHGRLAQRESVGDFSRRVVALAEQIEDAPPRRVVQRAEEVVHAYISIIVETSKQGKLSFPPL